MKKLIKVGAVAAGLMAAASGAFAQASGIDTSAIVPQITGISTTIAAIGGAILSVVVVAWGYRIVKGFMGR